MSAQQVNPLSAVVCRLPPEASTPPSVVDGWHALPARAALPLLSSQSKMIRIKEELGEATGGTGDLGLALDLVKSDQPERMPAAAADADEKGMYL